MKADQLRIGNFIINGNNGEFTEEGLIGKVLSIGVEECQFEQIYCECDESFEWFWKDNYFGIPLTEEWHYKFGVEKNRFNSFEYNISNRKKIIFSGDYIYLRDIERIDGHESIEDNVCTLWNNGIRGRGIFVHEWQNLYFSLTGEELEVKP